MAARLNWTAPSSDGGSPILDYRIERSRSGGAYTFVGTATGLTFLDAGAVSGDLYKVAARTALGTGAFTAPVTYTA